MSRLVALPGEIRNQIYHNVFEDGEVENLQFLQTCKQINNEAGSIGFSSTVFKIGRDPTLLGKRLQNLSHDRRSCIRTVCRNMLTTVSFKSLQTIYKASILPTSVVLLPLACTRTWAPVTGLRFFSLCRTSLSNIMSDVVMSNANLTNLTFSKVIRTETLDYRIPGLSAANPNMTNAKSQLQQYQLELDRWVTVFGSAESARVEEIERCRVGLKEVRITIKMKDSAVQRVLSVRWVMVLGDGGNK